MPRIAKVVVVTCLLLPTESLSWADGLNWKGKVGVETRLFENDARETTQDQGLALVGQVEVDRKHGSFRERARLFARSDQTNSQRDLLIVEEAWVEYHHTRFRARVGAEMFNWSATEAFHPADVLNSRNLDSDLENFEKLGEPLVGFFLPVPAGELSLFYLPVHVDPKYPSRRSRLNLAPEGWSFADPIWGERDGTIDQNDLANQWGVRWLQSRGAVDFDLHYLQYSDRSQPVFIAQPEIETVQPVYLPVVQVGGTLQAVLSSWLLKLEWAHRDFEALKTSLTPAGLIDQPNHWQVAWGLEYGHSYAGGGASTWVLEGQFVLGVEKSERASLSIFQRDLLVGYRHDFNDAAGRQLTGSLIFDIERHNEELLSLTYFQRVSDTWSLRAGLRLIHAPTRSDFPVGLEGLDGNNEVRLSVNRGF